MTRGLTVTMILACLFPTLLRAADDPAARRRAAQEFHLRAQQRTGLLIPLYVYPADVHTNVVYNRLIDRKRRYETVPVWVVLNPASGPGEQADGNYAKAVDRLLGAGCVVLGYVTTSYGTRDPAEVRRDVDRWHELYPRVQGVFFDEMTYEDTEAAVESQVVLNRHARDAGFWPTVGNPGADTPGRYFDADAADVIVVHEGSDWPAEERLKGDYFGGYADYPPFTRAALVHSQPRLDLDVLRTTRRHVRWLYVTDDPYRLADPDAANPWDTLSKHLDTLCDELARP